MRGKSPGPRQSVACRRQAGSAIRTRSRAGNRPLGWQASVPDLATGARSNEISGPAYVTAVTWM